MPLCLLLQSVVADGAGSPKALLNLTCLKQLSRPVGMMRPDADETIRLEFLSNRKLVAFRLAQPTARRVGPPRCYSCGFRANA
jgi:hypothetical protein